MKKVIFIGNIGCGKTTLSQAILGDELEYKKTQAVEVLGHYEIGRASCRERV